jgi:hypothetical protein
LDNEFLYGRTGNNIREFFHAFDWARNEGVGLVVKERGFPMDKVSANTLTHLATSSIKLRYLIKWYLAVSHLMSSLWGYTVLTWRKY